MNSTLIKAKSTLAKVFIHILRAFSMKVQLLTTLFQSPLNKKNKDNKLRKKNSYYYLNFCFFPSLLCLKLAKGFLTTVKAG